ncbi:MAG TPA: (d)CMP kinase [Vicinamibacterales bacterium]
MNSNSSSRRWLIAIDGPSGAGKGTIARAVARRLNYRHIDTGAMYRAVAWKAVQEKLDLSDEDAVAALASRISIDVGDGMIAVDGHDVRTAIRTPEMDAAAAAVARQPRVRQILIAQQREIGAGGGVVMEGRDIGTTVFPEADVKVYLDADPDERARRRAHDAAHASGRTGAAVQEVASALAARDRSDTTRTVSPLVKAEDAVLIDTTGVPIDEVVERVMALIHERGK